MKKNSDCCPTDLTAVVSDYKPIGETKKLGNADFETYISRPSGPTKQGVIVGYDIFGFHPNTKQLCDKLASQGFLVVMPDHFRGKPWPLG